MQKYRCSKAGGSGVGVMFEAFSPQNSAEAHSHLKNEDQALGGVLNVNTTAEAFPNEAIITV